MKRPAFTSAAALLAIGMLAIACDSTPPRGPGSIFISATTQLLEPDFFVYEIAVDNGSPRVVDPFENVSFLVNGLAHGPHVVELSGLPASCNAGGNRRDVSLRGDDTARVIFSIQCARMTGDLRVTVATTGSDFDLDGYLVTLDQQPAASIQPNGTTMLQFMPPDTYSVALSGVASNCTASSAQSVAITAGALATANFSVSCSPVAIVKFVTSASGPDRDPDGLTFRLNQGATMRTAYGTTNLSVPAGSHTWEIGDVQPNCTLSGAASGSLTIGAADTVTITAAATCDAIGYGTASTIATDAAGDTLPNSQNQPDPSHDILQLTTRYANNWLILVMRFAKPVGSVGLESPAGLQGVIDLDTDESVATGVEPWVNDFGGNAQQGVDYQIVLFDADSASVRILRFSLGFDTTTHRVPFKLEGDSVVVRIPLAKLGGDDGNMTITTLVGTEDRPTDLAPNSGVILARPPTGGGAVVANAISGVDAAAPARRAAGAASRRAKWPVRP